MRALVIGGAGSARVEEVDEPVPGAGQVVVDVRRAGICGTDVELFTGQLAYFAQGKTQFPVRPGHEWCGVVSAVGPGVPAGWAGVRVTGDTMLGCGNCARCRAGRRHVCADACEAASAATIMAATAIKLRMPCSCSRSLAPWCPSHKEMPRRDAAGATLQARQRDQTGRFGQTTPWSPAGTMPMPLKLNFCTRLPS